MSTNLHPGPKVIDNRKLAAFGHGLIVLTTPVLVFALTVGFARKLFGSDVDITRIPEFTGHTPWAATIIMMLGITSVQVIRAAKFRTRAYTAYMQYRTGNLMDNQAILKSALEGFGIRMLKVGLWGFLTTAIFIAWCLLN